MKTGRPRTFDIRKEDLERMRAAGLGRNLIAKVYGCHPFTVRHWLIKYGLPTQRPLKQPDRARMERLIQMAAK